jgi:hypothetical protein
MGHRETQASSAHRSTPEGVQLGNRLVRQALIFLAATVLSFAGFLLLFANW